MALCSYEMLIEDVQWQQTVPGCYTAPEVRPPVETSPAGPWTETGARQTPSHNQLGKDMQRD